MNKTIQAHLLLITSTIIYALSYTIGKRVVPDVLTPEALVGFRLLGATAVFWVLSIFMPRYSFTSKEWIILILGGILGAGFNQLFFIKSLEFTTPIMASIIMTLVPVLVLILSYFFLNKKITKRKAIGVFIGLIGAVTIILLSGGAAQRNAPNPVLGNFFQFINVVSVSIYYIIMKPLYTKYSPVHLFHWIYLFGLLGMSPFVIPATLEVNIAAIPNEAWASIAFIVFVVSCVAWLFNSIGLRYLPATTVTVYIFVQPILASLFAIYNGVEKMDAFKITAMLLVMVGVYLVSFVPKEKNKEYA